MKLSYIKQVVSFGRKIVFSMAFVLLALGPLWITLAAASAAGFVIAVPPLAEWIAEGYVGGVLVTDWNSISDKRLHFYKLVAYQQHVQQQRGGGTSTTSNGR